jgi:hypothetical protein
VVAAQVSVRERLRRFVRHTETDVLHTDKLPRFKAMLDLEDTELLLTYLTVPQMALPLVLRFFAERDIGLLLDDELVDILQGTLFEPRSFLAQGDASGEVQTVPVPAREAERVLGTAYGVLYNELTFLPAGVLRPLLTMLLCAVSKCVGGADSAFSRVLLLLVRVIFHVLDVFANVCEDTLHEDSGGSGLAKACAGVRGQLLTLMAGPVRAKLEEWLAGLEARPAQDANRVLVFGSYHS